MSLLGRQAYALVHPCRSGEPLREGHRRQVGRYVTTLSCTPSERSPLWIVSVMLTGSSGGHAPYRSWTPEKRKGAWDLADGLLDGVGIEALTKIQTWTGGMNVIRPMLGEEQIAAGAIPISVAS